MVGIWNLLARIISCSAELSMKTFYNLVAWVTLFEPQHSRAYLRTCAPSKDCVFAQSDQSLHWPILDSKGCKGVFFFHVDNKDSDQTVGMRRSGYDSSLVIHVRRYIFPRCGSFYLCSYPWWFVQSLRKHAYLNILKTSPPKTEFLDRKFWYFSYFCSKHRLLVLVRTASPGRF